MLLHYIDKAGADKPKIKVNDSCYTPSLETSRTTEMLLTKRHNNFSCFFISFQPVELSFVPAFSLSHLQSALVFWWSANNCLSSNISNNVYKVLSSEKTCFLQLLKHIWG